MIEAHDQIGILAPAELSQLRAISSPWNVVATFARTTSPADSAARAEACVGHVGPSGVCVVIDPKGRFSSTEFGGATGIDGTAGQMAARAGNRAFREGRWSDGVRAIVEATNRLGAQRAELGLGGEGLATWLMVAAALAALARGSSKWIRCARKL
jgi:hypothetical protein